MDLIHEDAIAIQKQCRAAPRSAASVKDLRPDPVFADSGDRHEKPITMNKNPAKVRHNYPGISPSAGEGPPRLAHAVPGERSARCKPPTPAIIMPRKTSLSIVAGSSQ